MRERLTLSLKINLMRETNFVLENKLDERETNFVLENKLDKRDHLCH
jgi:hypothetical protein